MTGSRDPSRFSGQPRALRQTARTEPNHTTTRTERMNMKMTMAAALVSVQQALDNCKRSENKEWEERWCVRLAKLVDLVPSWGSMSLKRDDVQVTEASIRYDVSYSLMDDLGYYACLTEHTVTVRPAFYGVSVRVSGRDRNGVKDMIYEDVAYAFTRNVTWDEPAQRWIVEPDEERRCPDPTCGDDVARALDHVADYEPRDDEAAPKFRAAIASLRGALARSKFDDSIADAIVAESSKS